MKLNSLVSRTLALTLFAALLAQAIATTIWYSESKQRKIAGVTSTSESMANMFASTITFFQSLPLSYRHIVLNQIRNMGGTRFFVSFNKQKLTVEPIAENKLKHASVNAIQQVLNAELPRVRSISVDFSHRQNLRLLKNDLYLSDLPKSWAHHTLTLLPIDPPVLVVQIELSPDEWIYIAALLPAPYMMLDDTVLGQEQWWFLLLSTSLLLGLTFLLMRRQVKPLKRLAKAANEMSMDINQAPLREEGASELVTATRAFNRMQQRIRRYISDRERLFSSISHDLKTPITRLRLRTELLTEPSKRDKFNRDLDELEMMVKGALQCVHDTDLHENNAEINLSALLNSLTETMNQEVHQVEVISDAIEPIVAKPLAIKRVMSNLIDNAVKYGGYTTVVVNSVPNGVTITISDTGKGIPEAKLEAVFEPYFRLSFDKDGHGLGLGICRNIVRGHGGDLILSNRREGGLQAQVFLPSGVDE
ncbi:HAMP domain-containing protein [Vibrio sinensis]|uniref:histidine kinase n=1 Tax=Vibrio sinensis TaxID=2302434 RepID=A0A3A6QQB1_9VIBR|nr:ATP-binding protein [Vibrio sinensis]RJX70012.1 HAMP domain-containing protein [Vibrio sinensis]